MIIKESYLTKYFGEILFFSIVVISLFGSIMIFSVTASTKVNPYYYFKLQIIYILSGIFLSIIISRTNYMILKKITNILLLILIALLVYVLLFSEEIKGAHRWINLPYIGRFQPTEFAKIINVLFISKFMDKYRSKIINFDTKIWILISTIFFICFLILIQPDIGIPTVIFSVSLILLFLGGAKIFDLFKIILPIIVILTLAIVLVPHRMQRIMSFSNPWKYHSKEGYQLIQSYYSLANGYIYGKGLGKSQLKEFYLPEAHTDFIFSIIGEEFGFLGVVILLISYIFVLFITFKVARRIKSFYGSLLIFGLILNIVIQAYINVAVAVGLLPTKGIGLPFISYGGSGILANYIGIGIILSIWRKEKNQIYLDE